MAKKEETTQSMLGFMPLVEAGTNGAYGLAVSASSALAPSQERIFRELHRQQTVIDAQARKTTYAAHKTSEIRTHGSDEFHGVMQHLSAINEAARGKDYQPYVEEFNHRNAQGAAQDLYSTIQAGTSRIHEQVGASLDLHDVPERKRNALQRLLGD